MSMKNKQIVILGSGYSGMIMALSLASKAVKSVIFEYLDTTNPNFFDDIRSTAISANSVKFFKEINIWAELEEHFGAINDIYVADNFASHMIKFNAPETQDDLKMGYLIQNTIFKKILYQMVLNNPYITLEDKCRYQINKSAEETCTLEIERDEKTKLVNTDLLIICDGKNSAIRSQYFSPKFTKKYDQCALTFVTNHQKAHEGTAVEHFMQEGPFAILPLVDQHTSSIVWTVSTNKAKALLALDKDEFLYLIQQNFGSFLGEIQIKSKVASYALTAKMMAKYYHNNLVLLADSAHAIHPLAGQGLNQGIKDIICLTDLITQNTPIKSLCAQYHQARYDDNHLMFELTDKINSIFALNSCILHKMRQIIFCRIEKMPSLKNRIVKYAMGFRDNRK